MCYFCHAQLFEITYAENIKSPFEQHSCQNAKVVEVFCDAGCRVSTRCRPSIHRPPVDALRVAAEMPIALSWAPLHADMHVVWCCAYAYHREQRRQAILIAFAASQCPTARDFVPWRFLVAGRFSVWSVSSSRRPKTCTRTDINRCTNRHRTAETFGQILSWLLETVRLRSAPELAVGARAEN
jgi:hypothetical protein